MWQVSGTHGQIQSELAISEMIQYHNEGLTTWDLADIYGPAESFIGKFSQKMDKPFEALTKFVPNPGPMSKSLVTHYIEQSMKKMNVSSLDMVQFHWWDYNNSSYLDGLEQLSNLKKEHKIENIGLTNFDTQRVRIIIENGFDIVSNQVQYSILDSRPAKKMTSYFEKHGIKILSYGTLLGGLFSEKYLGADEPTRADLDTASLQKYMNMIDVWGGWKLFQELLSSLDLIAKKHDSSIANVATRFILDKPQVAGVIIGARLGISEHREDNLKVFDLKLDSEDLSQIKSITDNANDLFEIIGDCGDEYR